jgi:uncharacterized protein YjbI with pentapeptide repeats
MILLADDVGPADGGLELRADCSRCLGLCCVALVFAASADFRFDKPAGVACRHLGPDSRCGIHDRLRQEGMPGCVAYDCFGAGQHVTQVTMAGADWRQSPETAERMFDVFPVMRQLHELAWYLTEALGLAAARPMRAELQAALDGVEVLAGKPAEELLAVDVAARRETIGALLGRASDLMREGVEGGPRHRERDRRGADLAGADLRGQDLRGTNLRGALLIGTDLRRADLRGADLAAADLRGANLAGADLQGTLFVTQSQLETASGDQATLISPQLARPTHWQLQEPLPPSPAQAPGN